MKVDPQLSFCFRLFLSELGNIINGDTHDTLDALLYRHEVYNGVIADEEKWMVEIPQVIPPQVPDTVDTTPDQGLYRLL